MVMLPPTRLTPEPRMIISRRPGLARLGLVSLALAMMLTGCGRDPQIVGLENPTLPAAAVPQVTRHKMFITTTRRPSAVSGEFYSAQRSVDLGLASVVATVPPNHEVGTLERPRDLPPDPRKEFTIVEPTVYRSSQSFVGAINQELAQRPKGERKLMLFVHGFNNNVSDAILRLAQFTEDTGYTGVPVLMTWASAARPVRYVYDLNSALIARSRLKDITSILTSTNLESVDIFAHSMGSLLTMEGLVEAQKAGTLGRRTRINNIVLASPDIDIDLFRSQIQQLPPEIRSKIYLLVSSNDRALLTSRRIAGGVPRVGAANASELEGLGVTVIDLSLISDSASGTHSKFAGSPEVVQLIGKALNNSHGFERGYGTGLGQILDNVPIMITN